MQRINQLRKGIEIMANNMTKPALSLIKSEERTSDGNLLPETRERVCISIQNYLRQAGYLNVSEISAGIGLSRQTTKKLIDEIISKWRSELENQIIIQIKWHQGVLKDMNENPESFSNEKIALMKLKSSFLNKVNSLIKVLIK